MQQCIFSLTAETLWWTPEFSEIRGTWTCSPEVPHKSPGWSHEVYTYWHLLFVSLCFFHAEARQGKCGRGVWSANSPSKGLCKSRLFLLQNNELSIETPIFPWKKHLLLDAFQLEQHRHNHLSKWEIKPYIKMSTAMSIYTVYIYICICVCVLILDNHYYIYTIILSYLKKKQI